MRFTFQPKIEILISKFHLSSKNIFEQGFERLNEELFDILGRFRLVDFLPEAGKDSLFCSGWTTKSCEQGSGLGLFISRETLQEFGGDIEAENHPSGGAQMTVWLPEATGESQ